MVTNRMPAATYPAPLLLVAKRHRRRAAGARTNPGPSLWAIAIYYQPWRNHRPLCGAAPTPLLLAALDQVAYSTGTAYAFSAAGTSGQCLTSGGSGRPNLDHLYRRGQRQHTSDGICQQSGRHHPEIVLDNTRTTVDIQAYSGQTADLLTAPLGFCAVWRL